MIIQYTNKYNVWKEHCQPFLNMLFGYFLELCEKNDINIVVNESSREDFNRMLFNCSDGELVDKNLFPYVYGLIDEEEERERERIEYEEKYNIKFEYLVSEESKLNKYDSDDDFPSRL